MRKAKYTTSALLALGVFLPANAHAGQTMTNGVDSFDSTSLDISTWQVSKALPSSQISQGGGSVTLSNSGGTDQLCDLADQIRPGTKIALEELLAPGPYDVDVDFSNFPATDRSEFFLSFQEYSDLTVPDQNAVMVWVRYNALGYTVRFVRRSGGSWVEEPSIPAASSGTLKIRNDGSYIIGFWNGTLIGSWPAGNMTGNTKVVIGAYNDAGTPMSVDVDEVRIPIGANLLIDRSAMHHDDDGDGLPLVCDSDQASVFVDKFDGASLDYGQWTVAEDSQGNLTVTGGSLDITDDGGPENYCDMFSLVNPGTGLIWGKRMVGDFHVRLTFSGFDNDDGHIFLGMDVGTESGGRTNAGIHAKIMDLGDPSAAYECVALLGGPAQGGVLFPTGDTSGTLEIRRTGNQAFAWDANGNHLCTITVPVEDMALMAHFQSYGGTKTVSLEEFEVRYGDAQDDPVFSVDSDLDGIPNLCDSSCTDADGDGVCDFDDNCPADPNAGQEDADSDGIGDVCDSCQDVDGDSSCDDVDNCVGTSNSSQADADSDGVGDACDTCPNDAQNDTDSDGVCGDVDNCPNEANADQADADSDGLGDVCDGCLDVDADGACDSSDNCVGVANAGQEDADSDGAGDACDSCPNDATDDADGDGTCEDADNCPGVTNTSQSDSDSDGIGDACDACANDAQNDVDADAICGDSDNCPTTANFGQEDLDNDGIGDACDADRDGDGVDNGSDNCPDEANPGQEDQDSDGFGDVCDIDRDGDGIDDSSDNCPDTPNSSQTDTDGDLIGDACDSDLDGDGVVNGSDNCPGTPNPGQEDADSDGQGDACDGDDDGDGVDDGSDNCPNTPNAGQEDLDGDGLGDVCDPDMDGDGVANVPDNCPMTANAGQEDLDGDATGDACDSDRDGDGVLNGSDNCVKDYNPSQADSDNDGIGDVCDAACADADSDGVCDALDNCPGDANPGQADADADGLGDVCDGDDDNDGVGDGIDQCPTTPAGDQVDAFGCSLDQQVPCDGRRKKDGTIKPWPNHQSYVSAVMVAAKKLYGKNTPEYNEAVADADGGTCGS